MTSSIETGVSGSFARCSASSAANRDEGTPDDMPSMSTEDGGEPRMAVLSYGRGNKARSIARVKFNVV